MIVVEPSSYTQPSRGRPVREVRDTETSVPEIEILYLYFEACWEPQSEEWAKDATHASLAHTLP